jgi:transposase-like protein
LTTRVPSSERTSQKIRELIQELEEGDGLEELLHLAVRRIIEETLEAEVSDVLGRGHYERRRVGQTGYRNGSRAARVKSAEGPIDYWAPQVTGTDEPFRSKIRPELEKRTPALEDLAVEMYARGLSTRDIEATFRGEDGRSLLSRTAVSEVTEQLWEEYEAFATRDLSEFQLLYLFVDGVAERLHTGQRREMVLCAWGITDEGEKLLLHLSPGTKEDTASCKAFFQDLKRRGLEDPLLVVTDGAPGLIRAVEECFPRAERQRCLAHRMRNLASKISEPDWSDFRAHAKACYEAPSQEVSRVLRNELVRRYEKTFPAAVQCFLDDFEACIAHLRFPVKHRRLIRTTNLLERLFLEERRRMKAVVHAFGERAVLKLMYAALIRSAESWRGITITAFEARQLSVIQEELDDSHQRRQAPAVQSRGAASPSRVSSAKKT